jgi:hypothetical protein
MTMFDAQTTVALFAAFLLGMVAGSGMEIIMRGGRHYSRALITESANRAMPRCPETLERLRPRAWPERRGLLTGGLIDRATSDSREAAQAVCAKRSGGARSRGAAGLVKDDRGRVEDRNWWKETCRIRAD